MALGKGSVGVGEGHTAIGKDEVSLPRRGSILLQLEGFIRESHQVVSVVKWLRDRMVDEQFRVAFGRFSSF